MGSKPSVAGLTISVLMIELLSVSRFSKSMKKDDFFFWMGPPKLPPKLRPCEGARRAANGSRELRLSSEKLKKVWPR
ncbi:MAG: hypothetical protein LC774_10425 [Acidobacteria bacterium]|nr:hypothetical protein [Acidobacteriota bacterium]